MAEAKTQPTKASVAALLGAIPDEQRRKDCKTVAPVLVRRVPVLSAQW